MLLMTAVLISVLIRC